MKLLYTGNLKDKYRDALKNQFSDLDIVSTPEEKELDKEIVDTDIFVSWGRFISRDRIKMAGQLKWVHALSTGVDSFLIPEIVESEILLTNSRGIHKEQISEHVFSFLLAFVRRQFDFQLQQQKKQWDRLEIDALTDRTLGIVGLGSIGEEIARKAKAFDMKVLATKRIPKETPNVDRVYPADQLHTVLPEVDFLVITTPLTNETIHLIGEQELSMMKENSFLINVARGEVIDEKALYNALSNKWIKGAGLDVFTEEPLPETSLFWELDNCYITPHVGGVSPDYNKKAIQLLKRNLAAFYKGTQLPTKVDKKRGY